MKSGLFTFKTLVADRATERISKIFTNKVLDVFVMLSHIRTKLFM